MWLQLPEVALRTSPLAENSKVPKLEEVLGLGGLWKHCFLKIKLEIVTLAISPFNLILSVCLFQLFGRPHPRPPPHPHPQHYEKVIAETWWYQASPVTCFILQHWLAASQAHGIFCWPAFQICISRLHSKNPSGLWKCAGRGENARTKAGSGRKRGFNKLHHTKLLYQMAGQ